MRDPFAPIDIVSITDPAVTFESDKAREEYERTRDPSLYRVREPGSPCFFTVRPCSAETAIRIDNETAGGRAVWAFRACVWRVRLPNGEVLEAKTYKTSFGEFAEDGWVETVARRVGPRRVREIGEAAHRLSMLDDYDPLLQQPGQPRQS